MVERNINNLIKRGFVGLATVAASLLHPMESASAQQNDIRSYFQCGSQEFDKNVVVLVEQVTQKGSEKFFTYPMGKVPGQCDNPADLTTYIPEARVTLNRSKSEYGLSFSGSVIWVNCPSWAVGYYYRNQSPTQGQGIYEGSGGLDPYHSTDVMLYINSDFKPNGKYPGTVTLNCTSPNGTTIGYGQIGYLITLVD